MPRKRKVDLVSLINAVESGRSSKEIMSEFGLKTLAQLKALYVDALAEKGEIKGIVTSRRKTAEPSRKTRILKVNQRGSLVIPQDMIEEMGYDIGHTFSVRKTLAGVSLKKN